MFINWALRLSLAVEKFWAEAIKVEKNKKNKTGKKNLTITSYLVRAKL
jgi:hypothetical protein